PSDTLNEVAPIPCPGIDIHVYTATKGNVQTVQRVKRERDENENPLEDADQRERIEELDLLGVGERSVPGLEVGDDVLHQKRSDGNNAGERVHAAPEKRVALTGAKGLYSAKGRSVGACRRCWGCGCCHKAWNS